MNSKDALYVHNSVLGSILIVPNDAEKKSVFDAEPSDAETTPSSPAVSTAPTEPATPEESQTPATLEEPVLPTEALNDHQEQDTNPLTADVPFESTRNQETPADEQKIDDEAGASLWSKLEQKVFKKRLFSDCVVESNLADYDCGYQSAQTTKEDDNTIREVKSLLDSDDIEHTEAQQLDPVMEDGLFDVAKELPFDEKADDDTFYKELEGIKVKAAENNNEEVEATEAEAAENNNDDNMSTFGSVVGAMSTAANSEMAVSVVGTVKSAANTVQSGVAGFYAEPISTITKTANTVSETANTVSETASSFFDNPASNNDVSQESPEVVDHEEDEKTTFDRAVSDCMDSETFQNFQEKTLGICKRS